MVGGSAACVGLARVPVGVEGDSKLLLYWLWGVLLVGLGYPGSGQSPPALLPLSGFSCRFRLTHTWRTPCARSAVPNLALSSAETR